MLQKVKIGAVEVKVIWKQDNEPLTLAAMQAWAGAVPIERTGPYPAPSIEVKLSESPRQTWLSLWEAVLICAEEDYGMVRQGKGYQWAQLVAGLLVDNPALGTMACVLPVPDIDDLLDTRGNPPEWPAGRLTGEAAWDALFDQVVFRLWESSRLDTLMELEGYTPDELLEKLHGLTVPFAALLTDQDLEPWRTMASRLLDVVEQWLKRRGELVPRI
jgi:hypothetical protein